VPLTILSVGYPLAKISPKTAGGAEQVLSILDRALIRRGHRSLVLAPAGSKCAGLLVPVPVPSGVLDEAAQREARRLFKQTLEDTLDRHAVDVVHMHGVDFFDYLPDCHTPIVVTLHLPLSWYSRFALLDSRRNITRVCVSDAQARTTPRGAGIHRVIHNGIELPRFFPPVKRGNYALAMGRICPEKGFHLAIDAAQRAGIKLLLAGTVYGYPEHMQYFQSMIAPRLGREVCLIGNVGGEHKIRLLTGAKCLLQPSLVAETSSLVAMEAMACGTPVIAWNNGTLPEIIREHRTGFLVTSVEQMADAIAQVNSIDPLACRREAERHFSSDRMLSEYLDLYHSVISEKSVSERVAA
jgi:glycosyltransferase involved in cell wall biosynthesis